MFVFLTPVSVDFITVTPIGVRMSSMVPPSN